MAIYDKNGKQLKAVDDFYHVEKAYLKPRELGQDIGNSIWGGASKVNNIPMIHYPCANFTDASITAIYPDSTKSTVLGASMTLLGQTIEPTQSNVLIGLQYYHVIRFEISLNTEDTPETTTYASFLLKTPYSASGPAQNDTVQYYADKTLDEIIELVQNNGYDEYVDDDFVNAVKLANKVADETSTDGIHSLSGKLWLALGDSYTHYLAGAGIEDNNPTPSTTGRWGALATKLGMTLYSYGIVSSTIRMSSDNMAHDTAAYKPMVNRVDTLITNHSSDADNVGLITFMGGANDGWSADKIGTIESDEYYTIYGALHSIFAKLIYAFPKATILVILQPQNYANTTTKGNLDAVQYGLVGMYTKETAVRDCAEIYSLPYCDCCFDWYSPINQEYIDLWKSDKIHLSDKGNELLTQKVEAKLIELFS